MAPDFAPIVGATADYGQLNGGVYEIEIPGRWNGELIVYFHGSHRVFTTGNVSSLYVEQPPLRADLISEGYAWAATSYDTNVIISGDAATQSAVLWDYFARRYGKPTRTYAIGDSMGGSGALRAVEAHADRFSGALVQCGVAGVNPTYDLSADLLAAGGYAVGVTQRDYEVTSLSDLVNKRIVPTLATDTSVRARFLEAWIEISGGPRPYAVEGYELKEKALWSLVLHDLSSGLSDNIGREYHFSQASSINETDFNARALRTAPGPQRARSNPGDPTGEIKSPVLILHTTGDGLVPLSELQLNVQRIQDRGAEDLVSVRTYDAPGHCQFTSTEERDAFKDLVQWVAKGVKPPDQSISSIPSPVIVRPPHGLPDGVRLISGVRSAKPPPQRFADAAPMIFATGE